MDNTIFLICNSVPHTSFTPPSLLTHSSSLPTHYSLTSCSLLPHFSITPPSLLTHSSLTSHSLLPHFSLTSHSLFTCSLIVIHVNIFFFTTFPPYTTSPSTHAIPPFPPTITPPSHPFYKSASPLCCVGLDM